MKDKEVLFNYIRSVLSMLQIEVEAEDRDRPWGGFMSISKDSLQTFLNIYFDDVAIQFGSKDISPKLLLVAPGSRLSLQYHHRRSELWRCVTGPVEVFRGNEHSSEVITLNHGDVLRIGKGEHHRLIGGKDWGIVAEIWIHEDESNPSDENDIVRISDDYGR